MKTSSKYRLEPQSRSHYPEKARAIDRLARAEEAEAIVEPLLNFEVITK